MKRERVGIYEENFRPGMSYVMWKMAGFPPGGLSMGNNGATGVINTCTRCKKRYFKRNEKGNVCNNHTNGTKN